MSLVILPSADGVYYSVKGDNSAKIWEDCLAIRNKCGSLPWVVIRIEESENGALKSYIEKNHPRVSCYYGIPKESGPTGPSSWFIVFDPMNLLMVVTVPGSGKKQLWNTGP